MRSVSIIGVGMTAVGEHWDKGIKDLSREAIHEAVADSGVNPGQVGAIYVSNMIAGQVSNQMHLGAYVADHAGYRGIEAATVEAACASGGAAVRAGMMAIASGAHDVVVIVGVEKMTDALGDRTVSALATAADYEYEVDQGATFAAINAMLMRRYQYEYKVPHEAFANFSINSHRNALNNPKAMFHSALNVEKYLKAPMVSPPINVMDSSPICDGSAALVLCATELTNQFPKRPVKILASASATDSLALHDRYDMLEMRGVQLSAKRAYDQAGLTPTDVDFFELHDAFTIMSCLSLEASGFAEKGKGTRLALEDEIRIGKKLPICTYGGLKARGHPVGATGVYEVAEAVLQLRCEAGANQVEGAKIGMTQNIGGSGATVVTHLLGA